MDIASGLVVYALLWWWMFLMTLPLGVRRTEHVEAGHDAGAPERPHLWRKALAATVLAALGWAVVYWIVESDLVSFRDMAGGG